MFEVSVYSEVVSGGMYVICYSCCVVLDLDRLCCPTYLQIALPCVRSTQYVHVTIPFQVSASDSALCSISRKNMWHPDLSVARGVRTSTKAGVDPSNHVASSHGCVHSLQTPGLGSK